MPVSQKYPITLTERLELGTEQQSFPGTLEEFVELADTCDYPIEFENGNIIAMSIASELHEHITASLIAALVNAFKGMPDFRRYGSNRHVFLPQHNCAYSPDASMVKGEVEEYEYRPGLTANLNPWLVAEVLSPSTRMRDYGEKLPKYREMDSLEYILLIEQVQPLVSVYSRIRETRRWQSIDYNSPEQSFELAGKEISLVDIYEGVEFTR